MDGGFLKGVLIKVEADAEEVSIKMEGGRSRKAEQIERIQKAEQHSLLRRGIRMQ